MLLTQQAAPQSNNDIEIRVTPVGQSTLRLTLLPSAMPVVIHDGSLARTDWGKPAVTWIVSGGNQEVKARAGPPYEPSFIRSNSAAKRRTVRRISGRRS